MSIPLGSFLQLYTSRASETEVYLVLVDVSGGRIASVSGALRGPRCVRARTLQAEFEIQGTSNDRILGDFLGTIVTDPCYWTPQLPYLYDLKLEVKFTDGTSHSWTKAIGLRRWEAIGKNLVRERKRVVLRGKCVEDLSPKLIEQAAEAELALLVAPPAEEHVRQADEQGVSLIVDLRGTTDEVFSKQGGWHPSVVGMIYSDQPESQALPNSSMNCSDLRGASREKLDDWCQVALWDLGEFEEIDAGLTLEAADDRHPP